MFGTSQITHSNTQEAEVSHVHTHISTQVAVPVCHYIIDEEDPEEDTPFQLNGKTKRITKQQS